ncbi:hypothetical protein XPA_005518 [Xanthoria parietina]
MLQKGASEAQNAVAEDVLSTGLVEWKFHQVYGSAQRKGGSSDKKEIVFEFQILSYRRVTAVTQRYYIVSNAHSIDKHNYQNRYHRYPQVIIPLRMTACLVKYPDTKYPGPFGAVLNTKYIGVCFDCYRIYTPSALPSTRHIAMSAEKSSQAGQDKRIMP